MITKEAEIIPLQKKKSIFTHMHHQEFSRGVNQEI
jgi:hypothetical protein